MGSALVRTLGLGVLAAVVLMVASDLPVLGSLINFPGLNWVIWIGLWGWLADQFVKAAKHALATSDNPSIPSMGAGALVGVTSGLAGQLIQLAIQATIMTWATGRAAQTGSVGASGEAVGSMFSAFGSMIAIFVYPAFGAFWGGVFGLVWGMRIRHAPAPEPIPPLQSTPNESFSTQRMP